MRNTGTRVQTPPFSLLRWVLRGLTATEMNAGAGHVVCKRDDWSRGKDGIISCLSRSRSEGKEGNVG